MGRGRNGQRARWRTTRLGRHRCDRAMRAGGLTCLGARPDEAQQLPERVKVWRVADARVVEEGCKHVGAAWGLKEGARALEKP